MKKALDAAAVIATITIAGWSYQQNKEIELSGHSCKYPWLIFVV